MFWTTIGEMLPVGLAIGLSPFAIVTAVVLLMGENGARRATLFALGWTIAIGIITTIAYLAIDAARDADTTATEDGTDVARIVLGLGFFVLAWLSWRKRPRDGRPSTKGRMLDRLTGISPLKAFGLGLIQAVVVVKNVPLAAAGGARLGESALDSGAVLAAIIVFAIVSSIGMFVLISLAVIGGERFDAPIAAFRGWLEENLTTITVVVTALIGAVLLGQGLAVFD